MKPQDTQAFLRFNAEGWYIRSMLVGTYARAKEEMKRVLGKNVHHNTTGPHAPVHHCIGNEPRATEKCRESGRKWTGRRPGRQLEQQEG